MRFISLQFQARQLVSADRKVAISNRRVLLFLHALIEAALADKPLTCDQFLTLCCRSDPSVVPDRTAIKRVILAANKAVRTALGDTTSAPRVQHAHRSLTFGPWQLLRLPFETWSVIGSSFSPEFNSPRLRVLPDPKGWCATADELSKIDALQKEGQYADALALALAYLERSDLRDEVWCLWAVRTVRLTRSLGQEKADCPLQLLLAQKANALTEHIGQHMRSEVALLAARTQFNLAPYDASLNIDFARLEASIGTASSAGLRWELANLRGLAIRRHIYQLKKANADAVLLADMAQQLLDTLAKAYFWAALVKDAHSCQAIACNMGNSLYWLDRNGVYGGLEAAVRWFKLAFTISDRFDLPQDSAWDFLMLGDMYLHSAPARKLITEDSLLWPGSSDPSTLGFYEKSVNMSNTYGNKRQQVLALHQLAEFLRKSLGQGAAQPTANKRDSILVEHPELFKDLIDDGDLQPEKVVSGEQSTSANAAWAKA